MILSKHHTDAIGTFGDFVGGVFGTVFTFIGTYLMYVTLRAQRLLTAKSNRIQRDLARNTETVQKELANKSTEEAKLQRFNALFFELLHLLQTQRESLNQSLSIGHDYFAEKRKMLYNSFVPSSVYGKSVTKAANHYNKFYLGNSSELAPYFRTLYRIMDLIEESGIDEDEQRQFAKIFRAHLSENELFFLRYNAMIEYGENFIEYINKYKLLKHLPIMSLMEMKRFREAIINNQRSPDPLKLLLHNWRRKIYRLTTDREANPPGITILEEYHKYKLSIDLTDPTKAILNLTIKTNTSNNRFKFIPFTAFSDQDFILFLKFILQEIYQYSNFERFNSSGNLRFTSNITRNATDTIIEATVKSSLPLNLSHPAWR